MSSKKTKQKKQENKGCGDNNHLSRIQTILSQLWTRLKWYNLSQDLWDCYEIAGKSMCRWCQLMSNTSYDQNSLLERTKFTREHVITLLGQYIRPVVEEKVSFESWSHKSCWKIYPPTFQWIAEANKGNGQLCPFGRYNDWAKLGAVLPKLHNFCWHQLYSPCWTIWLKETSSWSTADSKFAPTHLCSHFTAL